MVERLPVCSKETVSMTTRDRVRLDADIYRPDTETPVPVLLMRQPYGREIASTVVYGHPAWYAAHGFIVVVQDVRGRGTSDGEFRLFEHEVNDGYDAVEWAAQLSQSNGQVGMYGFSYQGMTQLFAAQAQPPSLKAIAPAMVGYHPYSDWAYENGALLLQAGLGWAIQLAAETARLRQDPVAFQALYQASQRLPLTDPNPVCPQVLRQHAADSFFHDWLDHPDADDYWHALTPQLERVDLPMLHIGGWFDPYLRGDMRLYQEMITRSRFPHPFWVGPWGHIPWGRKIGERDFGPDANSPIDQLQVDWFTRMLKQPQPEIGTASSITLFEMGKNRWCQFEAWPTPATQHYQCWRLQSGGLASMCEGDGQLIAVESAAADTTDSLQINPPADANFQSAVSKGMAATFVKGTFTSTNWIVHDPWRPVPSLGGHAGIPSGVFDRTAIDCRSDVLTFTSPPLSVPLRVVGQIEVVLICACDRPSFDLCITLSEITPAMQVYPMTQGYGRFSPESSAWELHTLLLQPTCFCIEAAHALRLSISAACYPAYALNTGTGNAAGAEPYINAKITTVAINSGLNSQTGLYVPLPTSAESTMP